MQELVLEGISVSNLDIFVVAVYLIAIIVIGALLSRIANKSVDAYFLGGRQMPWWLLGLSGTACYFDVSGVIWTIGIFYVMGQQFFWPQFMWGYVIALACFATFMGKWLRRSGALTGAEWMEFRFGTGTQGVLARFSYAIMAVTISVAFVGFAEYGCGSFVSVFIPLPDYFASSWIGDNWPHVLSIAVMGLTTIYTVSAGMIGVGFTGFIQFFIVLLGSGVLIYKAIEIGSYDAIAAEVPPEWFQFTPVTTWPRLGGWTLTESWVLLLPVTLTWVLKGAALGVGGPQQLYDLQRFLAAKTPREASLTGMIWGIGMVPMFMVSAAVGAIGLVKWGGELSNPEMLYPLVVGTMLPSGIKGLVLAGLLSAFMSTFSATVNAGASYATNDLYAKFVNPSARQSTLVRVSWISSLLIVVGGIQVGMSASNINTIFEWIMMVLGTAVLVPNVLRWYWWRFNGMGFTVGTLVGVAASIVSVFAFPATPSYLSFPVLLGISIIASVAATLATAPTDEAVLQEFYRRVQPFGWWGPFKKEAKAAGNSRQLPSGEHFGWDAISTLLTVVALQSLYLMSSYAVTHQWSEFVIAGLLTAICAIGLYFTWYLKLPDPLEGVSDFPDSRKGNSSP
jgi:SSS family solute:Na+ symporter